MPQFATNIIQVRVQLSVKELNKMLIKKRGKKDPQLTMNPAYQRDYIAQENKNWQKNLVKNIVIGESVIPYLYIRVDNNFPLENYKHFNGHLLNPSNEEQEIARLAIIDALIEIIDGQQRSLTVRDFIKGVFELPELQIQCLPNGHWGGLTPPPIQLTGLKLDEVKDKHPSIYKKYMDYQFTIVATLGTEAAIHQMFIDLNNLNKMSNQEMRNAKTCELAKYIRDTARLGNDYSYHKIFDKDNNKGVYLNFPFKRMGQDEVLAKVISIVDGSAFKYGLNKTAIDNLYDKQAYNVNINKMLQKKVTKVLDVCFSVLKNREAQGRMNVGTFLNLVMLVNELISNPDVKPKHWGKVWNWFLAKHIELSTLTTTEKDQGFNETLYHQKTRLGQDADGLDMRITILKKNGLYENDGVTLVDSKRVISDNDFAWMWIMADKKCTVPDDEGILCETKVSLGDAIKAHIISWTNGGKTVIKNTFVSCLHCNNIKIQDENWMTDEEYKKLKNK
tara:strand:- start:585 stop:2096 length:1512 start_codon:yes stop_codon:yes gene_type:complete